MTGNDRKTIFDLPLPGSCDSLWGNEYPFIGERVVAAVWIKQGDLLRIVDTMKLTARRNNIQSVDKLTCMLNSRGISAVQMFLRMGK